MIKESRNFMNTKFMPWNNPKPLQGDHVNSVIQYLVACVKLWDLRSPVTGKEDEWVHTIEYPVKLSNTIIMRVSCSPHHPHASPSKQDTWKSGH